MHQTNRERNVLSRGLRGGRTSSSYGGDFGFTLFEVLVVVAIGAASIVVALQFLPRNNDRRDLEQSAIELAAVMRGAQLSALVNQRESNFVFDLNKRHFWSRSDHVYTLASDTLVTIESARHSATEYGLAQVRFLPNGHNSGATIRLKRHSHEAQIKADWLTGTITVIMLP
jgi:type II secretion system protein H